jgi:Pyruvate/2-oxoacid:ferredoxin oxidoreductase gamma subunit
MARKRNPPKKPPAKTLASRSKTGKPTAADPRLDSLYRQVREVLTAARDRAWQAVNTVMVGAYWEVGRLIVEDEQAGKERAGYGKRVWKDSPSASRRSSARALTSPTSATCGRSS